VKQNVVFTGVSAVLESLCEILSSGQEYDQDNVHDHTLVPLLPWFASCGKRNFLRDTVVVHHIG